MRFRTILFLGMILAFVASTAGATIAANLYSAKISVPDQSPEAWNQALPLALQQALIKLSGNPEIIKNPAVKQALPKAKSWVKSYSYHEQWQRDQSQLWLNFDFDSKPLNQLLQQAHQPVWNNDRPLTLVWLEVKEDNTPVLVDAQNPLKKIIQQNADRRALPIVLPTLDVEEQAHFNEGEPLSNPASWEWAFAHYNVKAVLVGQLNFVDNKWQVEWLLIANGDSKQWDNKAANRDDLIANGLDESANWLAGQVMPAADASAKTQEILMQVADVQDLDDYAKISDYLSQLSFIKHVSLAGVTAEGMLFQLRIVGSKEQLVQALSNSAELIPDESSHDNARISLYYRWAQGIAKEPQESTVTESLE